MLNKVTIKITSIKEMGRNHELFCNTCLMLRKARKAGDVETINYTQLSALRRYPSAVSFEIINS